MYATPQYPPGYTSHYEYLRTPPLSPSPNTHPYYSPRHSAYTATPSPRPSPTTKGHTRRASHEPPQYTAHASPRPSYYGRYAPPQQQAYYASQHSTPRREPDYVSNDYSYRCKGRRYTGTDAHPDRKHHSRASYAHAGKTYVVHDDYPYDYSSRTPPPPYEEYYSYRYAHPADHSHRDQVPIYTDTDNIPHQTRARRNSHTARPTQPPPPKPKQPSKPPHPQATEEDARRANIPAGYSTKNWDPVEEPILLLGSVFDANSLGKWIYDWTVYVHSRASPLAEVAGELWLLLINLAGKVKRAEEISPRIRRKESRDLVEDFLESGERLWSRFGKLLKVCEEYMWKGAKDRTGGAKKPATMGRDSGVEFVDSMFGRDRELERTEKLMTAIRLWSMRFDANCEDILRHPGA